MDEMRQKGYLVRRWDTDERAGTVGLANNTSGGSKGLVYWSPPRKSSRKHHPADTVLLKGPASLPPPRGAP